MISAVTLRGGGLLLSLLASFYSLFFLTHVFVHYCFFFLLIFTHLYLTSVFTCCYLLGAHYCFLAFLPFIISAVIYTCYTLFTFLLLIILFFYLLYFLLLHFSSFFFISITCYFFIGYIFFPVSTQVCVCTFPFSSTVRHSVSLEGSSPLSH